MTIRNHAATYILGKREITEVSITPKHKNKSHVILMQTPSTKKHFNPYASLISLKTT